MIHKFTKLKIFYDKKFDFIQILLIIKIFSNQSFFLYILIFNNYSNIAPWVNYEIQTSAAPPNLPQTISSNNLS
jgi:hypothetical protein